MCEFSPGIDDLVTRQWCGAGLLSLASDLIVAKQTLSMNYMLAKEGFPWSSTGYPVRFRPKRAR